MPRLRNRQNGIPGDFQVLHPEAGMDKPFRYPSFDGAVTWEVRFRKGNPAIVEKYGWTLDIAEVERYVEQQNVDRLLAGGYVDFLDMEGDSPPKSSRQRVVPDALAGVAGHLRKLGSAQKLMVQWLGDGLEPVPIALAEQRGSVCAVCPQNTHNQGETEETLWRKFTNVAADQIKALIKIKNSVQLKTTYDDKLKHCYACDCVLNLKVHAPIQHIESNTHESVWPKLAKGCWLFSETGRTPPV